MQRRSRPPWRQLSGAVMLGLAVVLALPARRNPLIEPPTSCSTVMVQRPAAGWHCGDGMLVVQLAEASPVVELPVAEAQLEAEPAPGRWSAVAAAHAGEPLLMDHAPTATARARTTPSARPTQEREPDQQRAPDLSPTPLTLAVATVEEERPTERELDDREAPAFAGVLMLGNRVGAPAPASPTPTSEPLPARVPPTATPRPTQVPSTATPPPPTEVPPPTASPRRATRMPEPPPASEPEPTPTAEPTESPAPTPTPTADAAPSSPTAQRSSGITLAPVAPASRQRPQASTSRRPTSTPTPARGGARPAPTQTPLPPTPTATVIPAPVQSSGLLWPARGPITTYFGEVGWASPRGHAGLDIAAPQGAPVHAAATGRVVLATWDGGPYGVEVIIQHDGGLSTLYGHLSQLLVANGQSVQRGDVIGRVGSTGFSTGPHLHFEVRQHNSLRDPLAFLR